MTERPEFPADAVADCPCGSGRVFDECCGPLLRRETTAPTAERLMRSRYTANVVGDADYVMSTWHPSTRPRDLELDPAVQWRRLDVLDAPAPSSAEQDAAEVEFRAFWRVLPTPDRPRDGGVLHERSRFVRERGRWLYVDGDLLN